MATEAGKRNVATTKSGHEVPAPPEVSLSPPPPPGAPVPTPFPCMGSTRTASGTVSNLVIAGAEVVVEGSALDVNPPANSTALPTGDIITAAKKAKIAVTSGTASLRVGGHNVAQTGTPTAVNVTTPKMKVAQVCMVLTAGGGVGGGDGNSGGGGGGDGETIAPTRASSADQCTEAGHPVDVAKGYVVDRAVDVALPGALPFSFRRTYCSAAPLEHSRLGLGGWLHSYDQWVEPRAGGYILEGGEGRQVWFEGLTEGGSAFDRQERLTLTTDRRAASYIVYSHKDRTERLYERIAASERSYLQCIRDAFGNRIEFH